jgi:hypothetical protein
MLELGGGLPTGREALQPSEPHHSPDKATPSYYTKNENVASGISKLWCVSSHFHHRGGIYRAVGEMHQLGEVSLAPSGGRLAFGPLLLSHPVPRKRERSLHTCAQDVQITRMATIDKQMQCYK